VGRIGVDACGSGSGPMAESCEHSNEPLGSINGRVFNDLICDCQLLKKDSALWI
jgi:hypothetical protein